MGVERCYWRDVQLLAADLRGEWDERLAKLARSSGHGRLPGLLAMHSRGTPALHGGLEGGIGDFNPAADVQIFTPQICAQTLPAATAGQDLQSAWSKPPGVDFVQVMAVAPGGGGGSGRMGTTTTVSNGGGGGSGGNMSFGWFQATDLPQEVQCYVGAGGAGGAAITANSTSGNSGVAPNYTFFGSDQAAVALPTGLPLLGAGFGNFGAGGTTASAAGGSSPTGRLNTFAGGAGANSSSTGLAGSNGSAGTGHSPGGGGSGGGLTSGNVQSAGGIGAIPPFQNYGQANNSGGAAAGAGLAGTNLLLQLAVRQLGYGLPLGRVLPADSFFQPGGGGGGGGSSNSATAAGYGGNGFWGGGGGGGGAATNTTTPTSGAGGNGGDGFLIVVSW